MRAIRSRLLWIAALAAASILSLLPRNVTRRAPDAAGHVRDTTFRRVPISLGLDLRGGIHLGLEPDESRAVIGDCEDAIRRAERVVRTRVNEFGTMEPVVQIAGKCRLVVELPGIDDPARARDIVQRSAFLEFRITDQRGAFRSVIPAMDALLRPGKTELLETRSGTMSALLLPGELPEEFFVAEASVSQVDSLLRRPDIARLVPRGIDWRWGAETVDRGGPHRALYALESRAIITGTELRGANAGLDPLLNQPEVQFELSTSGGRRFADATGKNIGNNLAILLDGRVQGRPPVIQDRIGARGRIEMGGRTIEEANDLALVLRAGALPVPLKVVEQGSVGPTLGADSIQDGFRASALAVAFVFIVMGLYYRFAGVLATGALLFYVLFALGGLAVFGFTLTLPGLAGFALSIGMAVDANVLIFERIREEQAAGATVRNAVDRGFKHAMSAIVDSNVTTALTALILYLVGTDSVQGFAVTLLIGLGASMISAVFVTRTFMMIWLARRPKLESIKMRTFGLLARKEHNIMGLRRWAYMATAAFVVPGLILLAARGVRYSVEFTGGALIQVRTAEPTDAGKLRTALGTGGVESAEIQQFGSSRDYLIRTRGEETAEETQTTGEITTHVRQVLSSQLGANAFTIERSEAVGAKVGGELQQKAWLAILFSFVTTLIYLAFRFEWRFGLAAVLATAHDVLATIAFIGYLDLEVSLVVVAAVLTVLGYSLNDTIVIFDRVRENLRARPPGGLAAVLNRSINETLPRTVLTGGTALATGLVLAFFAGEVIKPFALVMSFGIVVGTFSSIYVASPLLLWIEQRRSRVGTGFQPALAGTSRED
jgi:protein-export membrane protein SecD/preprotein translocase SecF subunit